MQCLSPDQRARYEALAVLPEDVWMPQELLQQYWGLEDEMDTLRAINELRDRSLVQIQRSTAAGKEVQCSIKPHDLQRDYLIDRATKAQCLERLHARLIGAFQCESVVIGRDRRWAQRRAKSVPQAVGAVARYADKHLFSHALSAGGTAVPNDSSWSQFAICQYKLPKITVLVPLFRQLTELYLIGV